MKKNITSVALVSLILLGVSAPTSAAFTNIAVDPDNGDGSYPYNGLFYDVDKMDVDLNPVTNQAIVRVYTNFDPTSAYNNGYRNGDLFIGTGEFDLEDNSTDNWKYAFHLDNRWESPSKGSPNDGWLINTKYTDGLAGSGRGYSSVKEDNNGLDTGVMAKHPVDFGSHGPGETPYAGAYLDKGSWYRGEDYTSFTFNLGALTSKQYSFRWTMTCANDVIRGVLKLPGTDVAEPTIVALMLSGLGMIGFSRRRKGNFGKLAA